MGRLPKKGMLNIGMLGLAATICFPANSYAETLAAHRAANAVVLYDFTETSGNIIDKADSKFGAPLNLEVYYPGSTIRSAGSLTITDANVIRSVGPADKIYNQCKGANTTGGMSIELWIKNSESVERRSGTDAVRMGRPQPLRIISMSNSLFERNFLFGQFYDGGNLYQAAVNTTRNENDTTMKGNSLKDPLESTVAATIVPDVNLGRPTPELQKVVFTLGASGVGRLYLSDRNGNLYLAQTDSKGFGTDTVANYFNSWRPGAYLALGNEAMSKTDFDAKSALPKDFQTCKTADCLANPNRYWKGTFQLVAVYCNEIPKDVVLGSGVGNVKKNTQIAVDINATVSPLKYRAQEIYSRLTGVKTPITNPKLDDMVGFLSTDDKVSAAAIATDEAAFLNNTVRDFAAKMSNRDETINAPLNDFTVTVIGAVKDNRSAKSLLTEDYVYYGDPTKAPVPSDIVDDRLRSNNHYEALDKGRYDLSQVLTYSTQKIFNGTTAVDIPEGGAGLFTTRQWMAAHAIAGTNRRLVEYSFREFLCTPLDKVADNTGPDNVIGRDIDRFPGGSHTKFTTSCKACHTIMDGFRPAFARWTFSNNFAKHAFKVPSILMTDDEDKSVGMKTSPAYVAYKYNKNETVFPDGRVTLDDAWVNNAIRGTNLSLFQFTKMSGTGIRDFGQMIVDSPQFQKCMADRVFTTVCKRAPLSSDQTMLKQVASEFATSHGYNLKYLFQRIVTTDECLGGAQ